MRALDDSAARIILLIAPAGYGKTTLARQWAGTKGRGAVWYQGGRGSEDLAALAIGIADAVARLVPCAGRRMKRRLRGLPDPERDTARLADLLVRDLGDWPHDAWFVFDDYHHSMDSPACENFIELLATQTPMRLLIASRRRPRWATARQIAYGELFQLSQRDLSMTEDETRRLLLSQQQVEFERAWTLARGWPAVLSLLARIEHPSMSQETLGSTLYDFFAEELFQRLRPESQLGLVMIALAPRITSTVLHIAVAGRADDLARDAVDAGLLAVEGETLEMHPLVRGFLRSKHTILEPDRIFQFARRLARYLLHEGRWDEAFSVIEATPSPEMFSALLHAGLTPLMNEGRISTVRHWLRFARKHSFRSPEADLAEAELALRDGQPFRATFFARRAAYHPSIADADRSRALYMAGLSAHLADDFEVGIAFFEQARDAAVTREDLREALWGLFVAMNDLEQRQAAGILRELETFLRHDDADDVLRRAVGRFHLICRGNGSLASAFRELSNARTVIADAVDPRVIARFVQVHPQCAMLVGEYHAALELGDLAIDALAQVGVDFARLYVLMTRAYALLGLGRVGEVAALVAHLQREAHLREDIYTRANVAVVQARLFLQTGDAERAVAATIGCLPRRTCPGMAGELLATRALAYACLGNFDEANQTAERAMSTSSAIETQTASLTTRAITALGKAVDDADEQIRTAFTHVTVSGHVDGLNAALSACPELAAYASREDIPNLIVRVRPTSMSATGRHMKQDEPLTKREWEVLDLVAQGQSNQEISDRLFISVATVKVHIRHIFKKLGVRSRTEAALKVAYAVTQRRADEEKQRGPDKSFAY